MKNIFFHCIAHTRTHTHWSIGKGTSPSCYWTDTWTDNA